jgi:transcriptional regulator with XRE-family HTH domain
VSRRRSLDDNFLAEIARQYAEHVAAGRMPAPAIAATENTNVGNVHRWIYQARKRSMLPPGTPPGLCGGKIDPKPLGSAGQQVAANVRRIREAHRLTYVELSQRLAEAGRSVAVLGLRRIERGERRVDVDDLIALADVFGVRPEALWEPPAECETCHGAPPPGFACTECGTTTKEQPSA